jgi:hypothetical protein
MARRAEQRSVSLFAACAAVLLLVAASQACGGDSKTNGSGANGSGAASGAGSTGASGSGGSFGGQSGRGGVGGGSAGAGASGKAGAATGGSGPRGGGGTAGAQAGGSAGRGGSTAGARTGGDGGSAGTAPEGGGAGDGGSAALGQGGGAGYTPCGAGCEDRGFSCCAGRCVNTGDDPYNCGICGNECDALTPTCNLGTCAALECDEPDICPQLAAPIAPTCCGSECCVPSQLCCVVPGPVGPRIGCHTPAENEGTCPRGCLDCDCAAPNTLVATPGGERPIADLAVGDLVYSVEGSAVVAVPILAVRRTPVTWRHTVPRVTLANGAVLEISGRHPTADGRPFSALRAGDDLGGVAVRSVSPDALYPYPFTHDILPASSSAAYFAAGALIGSTIAHSAR